MPFTKIGYNKYRAPSGRVLSHEQVLAYYASRKKKHGTPSSRTHSSRDGFRLGRCLCDSSDSVSHVDPTGTGPIRRKYLKTANAAWMQLSKALRSVVVAQDFFGLSSPQNGTELVLRILIDPNHRAQTFSAWLDDTIASIVEVPLDAMMKESYLFAVKRAIRLVNANSPFRSVYTNNLLEQATRDLRGIIEATSVAMVRHMAFLTGEDKTPQQLFRELNSIIEKIGMLRTQVLIETYVVAAHAAGTLDVFDSAGVKEVHLVPEFKKVLKVGDARELPSASTIRRIRKREERLNKLQYVNVVTAGDNRVCSVCEDIAEDGPYTINRARALIPAHPRCRCAFVPARVRSGN
jgi:hypothetical protein